MGSGPSGRRILASSPNLAVSVANAASDSVKQGVVAEFDSQGSSVPCDAPGQGSEAILWFVRILTLR